MNVSVHPLAIGDINGPRVYLVIRQVGRHKDIEQMPDEIKNDRDAHAYAAKRWNVPECDVTFLKTEIVEAV